MKRYCYDCGRRVLAPFEGALELCNHCSELVWPRERVGWLHALWRRWRYSRGHSASQGR